MRTYTLIVPDSSPLITLAMAGALDLLLRPGLKIIIPDGVHWEVARDANLAGATDIIEWMKRNPGQVVIYPTQEFANHQTLIAAGVKRVRGLAVVLHRMWTDGTDFRWGSEPGTAVAAA